MSNRTVVPTGTDSSTVATKGNDMIRSGATGASTVHAVASHDMSEPMPSPPEIRIPAGNPGNSSRSGSWAVVGLSPRFSTVAASNTASPGATVRAPCVTRATVTSTPGFRTGAAVAGAASSPTVSAVTALIASAPAPGECCTAINPSRTEV